MTTQRFSILLLVLASCGPSTPATDAPASDASANEPAAAVVTSDPGGTASAAPTSPPDTGSFAAAASVDVIGSTLRLNYQGGSYTLSDSAIVPAGKSYALRFVQPAADGVHEIRLQPEAAKAGEPAAVVGKGSLVFHLTRSKTVEGKFNVTDISESCTPTGTVTFAEIPKAGGKGRGTIDVTVTCKGVDLLREPLVIKGEFSDVPLRNK